MTDYKHRRHADETDALIALSTCGEGESRPGRPFGDLVVRGGVVRDVTEGRLFND